MFFADYTTVGELMHRVATELSKYASTTVFIEQAKHKLMFPCVIGPEKVRMQSNH